LSNSASTKEIQIPTLDIWELFNQTAIPEKFGGHFTYLRVKSHMSWNDFLSLLPHETKGLTGWKHCAQCRNAWRELSTLATLDGQPVFLGGLVDSYPEAARAAIKTYQHKFRSSPVLDTPVRFFETSERHSSPNLGFETMGADESGTPYYHCFLATGLPSLDETEKEHQRKVNALVHQECPILEDYVQTWTPIVVKNILEWYTQKGESAAGYRVNIGGLRFMVALQEELEGEHDSRKRRCIVVRHLLELFAGPHPADACGAIHVFANSSNLAWCRHASTPESFWRMMDLRYNPTTYRQPTSTPTVGQVKAALSMVNGDLSCFNRQLISEDDPEVVQRALWRQQEFPVASSQTTMTAEQLLGQVRSKSASAASKTKSTCFDGCYQQLDGVLGQTKLNPDQFEDWLSKLPAGTELEYDVPHTYTPLEMGKPTTAKGLEMVKVPVGWVLPAGGVPSQGGIGNGWVKVKQVVPHPGRWRSASDVSQPFPVTDRMHAVVSDGYVVQLVRPHTWRPDCSCLFADFFRGEYHALMKTRQELHESLRMSQPEDGKPFRGIMLEVKLRGLDWKLRVQSRFRATLPGNKVLVVHVN